MGSDCRRAGSGAATTQPTISTASSWPEVNRLRLLGDPPPPWSRVFGPGFYFSGLGFGVPNWRCELFTSVWSLNLCKLLLRKPKYLHRYSQRRGAPLYFLLPLFSPSPFLSLLLSGLVGHWIIQVPLDRSVLFPLFSPSLFPPCWSGGALDYPGSTRSVSLTLTALFTYILLGGALDYPGVTVTEVYHWIVHTF